MISTADNGLDKQIVLTACGLQFLIPADVSLDDAANLVDVFTKIFCVFD